MARPDSTRNSQLFLLISCIPLCAPVRNTIPHAITTTTIVRTAVARLELTPSIPTFARIEVSAAKIEERSANNNHIPFHLPFINKMSGAKGTIKS